MRLTVLILLTAMVAPAHAQVAVVNRGNADVINQQLLTRILLGQVTTWQDGSQIILVMSDDVVSRGAVNALTGRDLDRLMRSWKRLIFSGSASMPVVTATTAQALALVRERAGALAIVGVSKDEVGAEVRVAMELAEDLR